MTKIQVLALAATFFQCVLSQGYDVQLTYGTQATVSDPGQKVVSVPVFLLSEKKRKPRQRTPVFQKPLPPFGPPQLSLHQHANFGAPFPANFPKPQRQPPLTINQPPQSFPPTRNVPIHHQQPPFAANSPTNSFNGHFRAQSPSQPHQQHRQRIPNNVNKPPPSQAYFSRPPSPVPAYQANFVKANSNVNTPSYHKPVPPPSSFNKQPHTHNQREKIRVPVQSLYLSAPQQRKPSSQPQTSYRKPSYSQPPEPIDYDKPSSTVYIKPPPSFGISVPASGPSYSSPSSGSSYNSPSPSYSVQSSSTSFAAPSASGYANPSSGYSSGSKPAGSSYAGYDSSVNYPPAGYSQPPSSYEQAGYSSEIVQTPGYSNDAPNSYALSQSTFSLPSKVTQFGRPSSESASFDLQDDSKASESSESPETDEDEDTTVSYKVVYIPLEVLKTILGNSGLK